MIDNIEILYKKIINKKPVCSTNSKSDVSINIKYNELTTVDPSSGKGLLLRLPSIARFCNDYPALARCRMYLVFPPSLSCTSMSISVKSAPQRNRICPSVLGNAIYVPCPLSFETRSDR